MADVLVPRDIARRAESMIATGAPAAVLRGVELLLQQNLRTENGGGGGALNGAQYTDCSSVVKKGMNMLGHAPFELLGVPLDANTLDVRKAYKKLALKYHPDKNPKTTPLFQLIQAANTRLASTPDRMKEVQMVQQRRAAVDQRRDPAHAGRPPMFPQQQQQQQPAPGSSASTSSTASAAGGASQPKADQRRKNYYEELLREQYRKAAESDRKAQEFAAKRSAEQAAGGYPGSQYRQYSNAYYSAAGAFASGAGYAGSKPGGDTDTASEGSFPSSSSHAGGAGFANPRASDGQTSHMPGSKPNSAQQQHPGTANSNASNSTAASGANHNYGGSSNTHSSSNNAAPKAKRVAIPRPFALRFSAVGSSMVELEWKVSTLHSCSLAVELSWRERGIISNGAVNMKAWEISDKLIRSGCVRKKNLAAGSAYDFRVRAVEELQGGLLGGRSDWTEPLYVVLQPDTKVPSAAAAANSYKSMHNLHNASTNNLQAGGSTASSGGSDSPVKPPFKRFDSKSKGLDRAGDRTRGLERLGEEDERPGDVPTLQKQGSKGLSSSAREAWAKDSQHDASASAASVHSNSSASMRDKRRDKDPLDDPIYGGYVEVEEDIDQDNEEGDDIESDAASSLNRTTSTAASSAAPRKGKTTRLKKKKNLGSKKSFKTTTKPKQPARREEAEAGLVEEVEEVLSDGGEPLEERDFVLIAPSAESKEAANKASGLHSLQAQGFRHPVRAEPFARSRLRGYLVPDRPVKVSAECGDWLRVQVHIPVGGIALSKPKRSKGSNVGGTEDGDAAAGAAGAVHGWCQRRDKSVQYLVSSMEPSPSMSGARPPSHSPMSSFASPPGARPPRDHVASPTPLGQTATSELGRSLLSIPRPFAANRQLDPKTASKPIAEEDDVEVWLECFDEHGNSYYFNEETETSSWEPPEWIEEHDPTTQTVYYVHIQRIFGQLSLTSTWEKPKRYARLIRSSG